MPIKSKQTGNGGFEKKMVEEGSEICRLFMMVYYGEYFNEHFGESKDRLQFFLEFPETTEEFDGEERPLVMNYDASTSNDDRSRGVKFAKTSNLDESTFRDADGEIIFDNLLGSLQMASVEHKTKKKGDGVYARITGFTKAREKDINNCPEGHKNNYLRLVDLTDPDLKAEDLEGVYNWVLKDALANSQSIGNPSVIQEVVEANEEEYEARKEARKAAKDSKESAPEEAPKKEKAKKEKKAKKAKKAK